LIAQAIGAIDSPFQSSDNKNLRKPTNEIADSYCIIDQNLELQNRDLKSQRNNNTKTLHAKKIQS
jgi:hypothetical protein